MPPTPFDIFRAYVRRYLCGDDMSGYPFVDGRIWDALKHAAEMTERDCPNLDFFRPLQSDGSEKFST